MTRKISIFGATGSIGCNTIDLIGRAPDDWDVVAVTGSSNVQRLADQARTLHAELAVTADEARYAELKDALAGTEIEVAAGEDAIAEASTREVDLGMSAIVGSAGLKASLGLAAQGATLALANKESLVCAGSLVRQTVAANNAKLLPVDSEHSAIFQALQGENSARIERILLTASGGPFRNWTLSRMENVTLEQAMAHPNWDMGQRISIDSATMFNKSLEVIEAQVLFDVHPDQIEVVVHPQSIIHSMIGFVDGAIMAQLGPSDMRGPIGYALNYPDRAALPVDRISFAELARLDFQPADPERFPALALARRVMAAGGLTGAVFNAAKESALDAFIDKSIGFLDMARLVAHVLDQMQENAAGVTDSYTLDDVMEFDTEARALGRDWAKTHGDAR